MLILIRITYFQLQGVGETPGLGRRVDSQPPLPRRIDRARRPILIRPAGATLQVLREAERVCAILAGGVGPEPGKMGMIGLEGVVVFPIRSVILVEGVTPTDGASITMMGVEGDLAWQRCM